MTTNPIFAATTSVSHISSLDREIDKTQKVLENLGNSTDRVLERADARISDPIQSERIEQKQAEIQELVDQAQEALEDTKNKKEIQAVLQETKNIINIKVESAVTPTTDITDSLGKNTPIAKKDIEQAKETLIESLESENLIRLMIQTSLDEVVIRQKLEKYDNSLGIDFQFDALTGEKVYEIFIHKGSLLEQELLPNTETGEIPKSLFGMMIVQPELYSIGRTSGDIVSMLQSESLDKLWGIRSYGGASLLEQTKNFVQKSERKVRVAIIDTGIESTHGDIKDQINIGNGYDFVNDDTDPTDDQGHGTHVAGTIAGSLDGKGIVGVNPWVELTALKICDNKGFCPSYAVIKALTYAKTQNYDVINMSLGARGNPTTSPICGGIQELSEAGTIVVAAAGNSNVDTSTFVPGGCASAVTVAAVDQNMKRASFSNYGTKVDVAAPGVAVYSSYLGGGYKSLNGTSMATPHIVGLASIARLHHPNMTGEEFKILIKNTKTPVNTEASKPVANFVNVQEFLNALTGKQEEKKDERTPVEKKEEKSSDKEKQVPPTQTGSDDVGNNELKAVIDESIGLEIQNDSKMEINSVGATEEERIEINSSDSDTTESIAGEQGVPLPEVFVSEGVAINNTEDGIDFSTIDVSTGIMSTGDTKKLYGQEKTTIEISERDIPEGYTLINTDADEEYPVFLGSQDEPLLEESQDTAIQNTYTCTTYIGYTCSYNLPAASIRQYNMSNTSVASVSAGSSSFTITGRSPGSSVLYVNYAGRTIATVYITIQKLLVPIGANYGTNTLEVGQSTYLSIRSGNGGYSVSSSNPSVISVSGNNTQWTLSAMNPGTATITYRDSAGYYGTINLTVTAPPRNLSISIGQTTLERGKTTSLTITDGNGGYSVSSSNTNIISIAGSNTNWTLSAVGVGTSTLTVRDNRGKIANISITVLERNPTRTLRVSYNPNPHHIGGVSPITITDGNGGYTVTSSNPAILSVSGGGTAWTVTANSSGSVTVTIQDQRGITVRLLYTVLRQVKGTLSNVSPFVGQTATFTVTNGNGGYTLTSSNPSVATVRQTTTGTDTHYTITALTAGETTLTIRDRYGSSGWIKMTVRTGAKPFTVDKTTLTVEVGQDAYFRVTSGNGGYGHSMTNGNVSWSYDNSSIPSYRVRGVSVGSTILQIRDSSGKVVQVRVEVVEKREPTKIEYIVSSEGSDTNSSIIGNLFYVTGDYSEVGIEVIDSMGGRKRKTLEPQENGIYVALINTRRCQNRCVEFRAYAKDRVTGNIIYTEKKVLSADATRINATNNEGDAVEINQYISDDVKKLLSQYINVLGQAVNTTGEVIIDAKDIAIKGGKDITVNMVLWVIAGVGKLKLPISAELLGYFLDGDGKDRTFEDPYWISQEYKKTDSYTNLKSKCTNQRNQILSLGYGRTITIGSGSFSTPIDSKDSARQSDFYYGIKKHNWYVYGSKDASGKVFCNIEITDTYDFPSDADYGNGITNTLNSMGYYHQKNLKGKAYNIKLKLIDQLY